MSLPKSPLFKPVLFFDVVADEGIPVLSNASKSLTVVNVKGGSVKSVDPAYPFEASIEFGSDDLTTPAGSNATNLDCKLYLKTKNGSGALVRYLGVVHVEGKTLAVVANQSSTMEFSDGYVTNHPSFTLDAGVEKEYGWVATKNLIGKGRFVRDASGVLHVEYVVYVVE